MNLFYNLPVELQDTILIKKRKLELWDVHEELRNDFENAYEMIRLRKQFVYTHQFQSKKIDAFDKHYLQKMPVVLRAIYLVKTKWKRFFGDRLYRSMRNPWNYSWVTDIPELTRIELIIHCQNNNLSTLGDNQELVRKLLTI